MIVGFSSCGGSGEFVHPPHVKRGGRSSGVEHNLAKVRVVSSNLIARSNQKSRSITLRLFCFRIAEL